MNCNEIRRLIPSVFRGETSLTEWALVEAHLKRCTGCEAERQRVEEEASRLTPTWLRGLADSATGLAERVPGRPPASPASRPRPRARGPRLGRARLAAPR
jgi:predicted anti-sigma-YlaC factor YlaD